MRSWQTGLIGALAVTMGCLTVRGNTFADENRFANIVPRNVFGLKPPPVVDATPPPPPPPSITVKLTGIISFTANPKAILQVTEKGKAPESKVLSVNQAEGSIEVKAIDPAAGKVTVVAAGNESVLDFEKDGVKPSSGGAAGSDTVAGLSAVLKSGAMPYAAPSGTAAERIAEVMKRLPSSPSPSGLSGSRLSGGTAIPSGVFGQTAAGGQTFTFDPNYRTSTSTPNWPPEQKVSVEESHLYIELNRHMSNIYNPTLKINIPMPPMPPTMFSTTPQQPEPEPETSQGTGFPGFPGLPPPPPK